jgi:hypothetical protein
MGRGDGVASGQAFPYHEADGSTLHPEQQAQLTQMATKAGTNPERLVIGAPYAFISKPIPL